MSLLVQTSEGFVLDAHRSSACIVGSAGDSSPDVSSFERAERVALVPPSRADFIRGLLALWSVRCVPVLVPRAPQPGPAAPALRSLSFSPNHVPPLREVSFAPDDVVCELLTSGSTGTPQSFDKTARQIFGEAIALKELLGLSERDTILATTASHHLYGLLFSVLAPICSGSNIVASPDNEPGAFHPEKVAVLAAQFGVTHLVSVPAHLRALLEAPVALPTIRTIVSSAAPLAPGDARRLEEKFGVAVVDVLGSTETGGIATRRPAKTNAWSPIPGVEVRLDRDERLLIKSPFLASPSSEERSDERARVHEDGTFEYLGRADDVVKIGGKRVSLGEIEQLTRAIPGVTDCACVSRAVSGLRGQEILLVGTPETLDKGALRSALRRNLDPAFVPRKMRFLAALPRDERGKLKRDDLLSLFSVPEDRPRVVETTLEVPAHWSRFVGHFENDPLLPAVSQLADFILPEIRRSFGGGALSSLKRVKWTHAIRPGTELTLRLENKPGGVHFQLSDGSNLACSGTAQLASKGS